MKNYEPIEIFTLVLIFIIIFTPFACALLGIDIPILTVTP